MSDRDKGLNTAISNYEPRIIPAYCCFHLRENFTTKFGRGLMEVFWKIARAIDSHTYTIEIEKLRSYNHSAAEYLADIPASLWVAAYFPVRQYGQDTSNIVEQVNTAFKTEREYSVIDLLSALWHRTMTTRYQRQQQAAKHQHPFTTIATKEVQKYQLLARMH